MLAPKTSNDCLRFALHFNTDPKRVHGSKACESKPFLLPFEGLQWFEARKILHQKSWHHLLPLQHKRQVQGRVVPHSFSDVGPIIRYLHPLLNYQRKREFKNIFLSCIVGNRKICRRCHKVLPVRRWHRWTHRRGQKLWWIPLSLFSNHSSGY